MIEPAGPIAADRETPTTAPEGPDPGSTAAVSRIVRALSIALGALCLFLFAKWLPIYLNWPWYTDHDHFAQVAEAWNRGRLPYRDVFTGQFPGEIHLFRATDALLGRGNSAAFYAVDAALVFAFGVLVALWSRRRFGIALPGLVALTLFLAYYVTQGFEITAQREWHAMFLVAAGFFALELLPGHASRIVSGACVGAAISFRPQVVLFAPGLLLILDRSAQASGATPRGRLWAWSEWGLAIALTALAAFLPLILDGLMADFWRCIRSIRYGSGFSLSPRMRYKRVLATLAARDALVIVPIAWLLLVNRGGPRRIARREVLGVLAILAGTVLYGAASPHNHPNYQIPIVLWLGIVSAYLVDQLLVIRPAWALRATLAFAILVLEGNAACQALADRGGGEVREVMIDGKKELAWTPSYTIGDSIDYLRRGVLPEKPTGGRREWTYRYPWADYRPAIEYLRRETKPETPVVSLLLSCNTGINIAIPRLSPLPCDPIGMISFEEFAGPNDETLGSTPDCVVVCDLEYDEKAYPQFAPLYKTVRAKFRREAAFGHIEIWRRVPDAVPDPVPGAVPGAGASKGG